MGWCVARWCEEVDVPYKFVLHVEWCCAVLPMSGCVHGAVIM